MSRTALATTLLLASCAGAPAGPSTPVVPSSDVRRYFPLEAGMVWSYEVDTAESMTTLGTVRVLSVDAEGAHVATNGAATSVYVATAQSVRRLGEEGFVLHAPLEVGATFLGEGGRAARVDAVDARVRTGMGELRDCIRVVTTGGELGNEITTVYCPEVGAASITTSLTSETTGEVATLTATLIGLTRAEASDPAAR